MIRWIVMATTLAVLTSTPAFALSVTGMPVPAKTDAQRSCYDLSAEITELSRKQPGTPGFWSRTEHKVAGVFALINPLPALAYLGYGAYQDVTQDWDAEAARARIVDLRGHLARKQCFVR